MRASDAIGLMSVGVAFAAIVVNPWLAARAQRNATTADERRRVYSETLYWLRLRHEDVYNRSMGVGTPSGEPTDRELKESIARLSLYASPKVWTYAQAFMMTYGTGGLAALTAEAQGAAPSAHALNARVHLGEVAKRLNEILDHITDAMRCDLRVPHARFYVRDRDA